jgi:8-oxo-dGTP pyrophosphatase MutT (NUDIX family)
MDNMGRILLIHRYRDGIRQWEIPGGKINDQENAMTAASREVKEEIGVEIEITKPLGIIEFSDRDRCYEYHWYLAQIPVGNLPRITEPEEHDALAYFGLDEITHSNELLSPNVIKFIEACRNNSLKLF